jgi:tRNA-2-methylthio-N6-dimethylallyladenosine synthase
MHYHIWTIGCQMNKAESNRIAGFLEHLGYTYTTQLENADLLVLNTCMVRQNAEDKILGTISTLKGIKRRNPGLRIMVTGCFVDTQIHKLYLYYPHIDLFFKPGDYRSFLNYFNSHSDIYNSLYNEILLPQGSATTAFIPIIEGCNNFCSYCIVPYRRGREKSRSIDEIINEINVHIEKGAREITLLGQNVNSYGRDLPGQPDLGDLLYILNNMENLKRIRFLTNHPKDMSEKLIKAVAALDKVCEHLSLPFQSGNNDILRVMRRSYTVENYKKLLKNVRQQIPGVALSTDVIVGFPGESDEQFEHSVELIKETRFDSVHIAAYTPRPSTIATRKYKDDVPPTIKKQRLQNIEMVQTCIAAEINAGLQDTIVEILVEGNKKGKWYGRTRSDKLVFFKSEANYTGQLVNLRIINTSPWSLQGELVNN